MGRMLHDWTKYETEVLERHTGPADTTFRTTWDDVVPDGDIGALATPVCTTFEDCSRPDHPFGDNNGPAITNAILAYHSWSTQQSIHLHTPHDDPGEGHPVGPPALGFYLHKDATTGAHRLISPPANSAKTDIGATHTPQSNKTPNALAKRTQTTARRAQPTSPQKNRTPQRLHDRPTTRQARHLLSHPRQLPTTPRREPHKEHSKDMPTTDGHHRFQKNLPGITTMEVMRLLAPHTVQLRQGMHLFITTRGTAAIEGTAPGDDDQTPQARPTQAVWLGAKADTHIAVDGDLEWTAIEYTLDCAESDPTLTGWQTRWAAEVNCHQDVALDDTVTPQATGPAERAARTHLDPTKHTFWHYHTTIHPAAVTQIKEALSPTLPDNHNAHHPGMFTIYPNFRTDIGIVSQVAEPPLPPTVTALARRPKPWRTERAPNTPANARQRR